MHTDYEVETWGRIFCNHNAYALTRVTFEKFMNLPDKTKRQFIRGLWMLKPYMPTKATHLTTTGEPNAKN